MSQKTFTIVITDEGISCKTHGYSGQECLNDAGKILKALADMGIESSCEAFEPTEELAQTINVQQDLKSNG